MKQTNKLKMIATMAISVIGAFFATSCNNDSFFGFDYQNEDSNTLFDNNSVKSQEVRHPLIEGHYVDFIDDQYVITISQKEAKKIGITKESYTEFQNAIIEGNRYLATIVDSLKRTGKNVIGRTSMYDAPKFYSKPRTKSFGEPAHLPSGYIETIGQEHLSQGINKIPNPMASVDGDCYSNVAILPIQVLIAEAWHTQYYSSNIGQHVSLSAGFIVSNVPGSVTYGTSDSNGGRCSWRGSTVNLYQQEND